MSMLPTPMGQAAANTGTDHRTKHETSVTKGLVTKGVVAVAAVCLLSSCQLVNRARVPALERALASEGADGVDVASSPSIREPAADAEQHEPDLLQAAPASSDEPSDETPGEGPRPPTTFDASKTATASRYASLDRQSCEAELMRRHIAFERVGEARGVIAPLRLKGPLSGVTYRSNLSAKMRETAVIEIYDCRLVLALDDFARILAKHDIVEVIHLSVYRPVSSRVDLKGNPGRRHGGALAIDAAIFKTKDGKSFDVQKDFKGRIGAKPCPAPSDATELRKIACEANEARLFNVLLTPDYNWAHRNHFHMEVTAGVRWTLVR